MKPMSWLPDLKYVIQNPSIICGLLPAGQFVSLCKDFGINTSERQLEQLEKLGIFYPFARVQYPNDDMEGFIDIWSQEEHALRWLENGSIWEPSSRPFQEWKTFREEGKLFAKIISFYSRFQCYNLYKLKKECTIKLGAEFFVDFEKKEKEKLLEDISNESERIIAAYQRKIVEMRDPINQWAFDESKNKAMWRGIAAKICQILSNRYFPETQSDGRSISISQNLRYRKWNWYEYCRDWNANAVLNETGLDIDEIKILHRIVAFEAKQIDPLDDWYELVSFVSLEKKKRLKGDALFAQEIYSMEMMLRLFYEELTNDKLPFKEVPPYKNIDEFYKINVKDEVFEHLKYIVNDFNLNPKPNLILVVEGEGEEKQFPRLAEELLGYSFPILGIEVRNLKGVGNFTGKKTQDKYGALEKFIDDHHSRQTIVFIVLDNEGGAEKIKYKLVEKRSTADRGRTVTKDEYVHLWRRCIEFDNFSSEELAKAMTELCNYKQVFASDEIETCIKKYDSKKGDPLEDLFQEKTNDDLFSKTKLLELLFNDLIMNREKELEESGRKDIVKLIIRIIELALINNQPVTKEIQRINQESGYFGKRAQ